MKKYQIFSVIFILFVGVFICKKVLTNKHVQLPGEICNTCYTPGDLILNGVSLVPTGFLRSDKGQLYIGELGTKQVIDGVSVYFFNNKIYTFSEIKSDSKNPYVYIEWARKPVK